MRPNTLIVASTLLLATAVLQAGSRSGQQQNNTPLSYTGEIMDSKCAGQGSHNQVMTKEGVKNSEGLHPPVYEGWRQICPIYRGCKDILQL